MIELNCLGQPTLHDDAAQKVEFSSSKVFALFIFLAVTNKPVSRLELEGLLWGESEAKKAQTSLRSAIYNINKYLDGVLITDRKTVTFAAGDQTAIDLKRFDALVRTGTQEDLETACSLYRGPLLDQLTIDDAPEFEHWLVLHREQYRLRYFDALSQLVQLYTARGSQDKAIGALNQLIELEPWQEGAYQQLMTALARRGSYNRALKVYDRCQDNLKRELDIEPMPETVAIYEEIKALRDRPVQHNLPAVPTSLVGRETELESLVRHLLGQKKRLVTLVGYGGVGKSSLALEIGHRLARHFLHGVTFVPLASVTDPAYLELKMIDSLGVDLPPQAEPTKFLVEQLSNQERLLILDNAEQLIDPCADLIVALLQAAERLTVLVTSREPLAMRSEQLVRLGGLPFEPLDGELSTSGRLFRHRAVQIDPNFEMTSANFEAINQICNLVDGLPLALELAAAQTASQSCKAIEQTLRERVSNLTGSYRDLPPRHRSLRALFDQSWLSLSDRLQQILAGLSCFRGGFSAEAAAAVCEATQQELAELYAKSLLKRVDDRYDMHNLVVHYAAEQLVTLGKEESIVHDHGRHFRQALRLAAGSLPRADHAKLKLLRLDVENIRAAWLQIIHSADWVEIGATTHPLAQFIEASNSFQEGKILFQQTIEQLVTPNQSDPLEQQLGVATIKNRLAVQYVRTGNFPDALLTTDETIEVLQRTDAQMELAFALNLNGVCRLLTNDIDGTIDRLERCAAIYLALEAEESLKPLVNLGSLYMRSGRYREAIETLQKGIPQAETNGDDRALAHMYNNICACLILTNRYDEGLVYCNQAIEVCERIDFYTVKTVALQNKAELLFYLEEYANSLMIAEESLALAIQTGSKQYELISLKKGMLA
ncbi:MAG: BTAD domain-containing putative transcriptional regulator, partial [Chloroflexota bacterium]